MNFDFIIIVVLKCWFMDCFQGEDDDTDIEYMDFPKFVVASN